MIIALGTDHAGFDLKEVVKKLKEVEPSADADYKK